MRMQRAKISRPTLAEIDRRLLAMLESVLHIAHIGLKRLWFETRRDEWRFRLQRFLLRQRLKAKT